MRYLYYVYLYYMYYIYIFHSCAPLGPWSNSTHTYTHTYVYTYVCIYIYIYREREMYTYIYIYIYTRARAHAHAHVYVMNSRYSRGNAGHSQLFQQQTAGPNPLPKLLIKSPPLTNKASDKAIATGRP